jgi:hypothetical protein
VRTQIRGEEAPWPEYVRQKWLNATAHWPPGEREKVTLAGYFTPRPYVDEWNRGSSTEGFTYVLHHTTVCQLLIPRPRRTWDQDEWPERIAEARDERAAGGAEP